MDSVLQELLYEQMKQSAALDADVEHYPRTPSDRTYSYVLDAMARFYDRHRLEKNRLAQDIVFGKCRVWRREKEEGPRRIPSTRTTHTATGSKSAEPWISRREYVTSSKPVHANTGTSAD